MKHTGANWAYISFPGGGERIAALLGGHVNMMVIEPQEAGEHIRAGNMRVIAQIADKRLPPFPDVPTVQEAGFDVPNVPQVRGIVGPPGMPARGGRVLGRRVRQVREDAELEEIPRRRAVRGRIPCAAPS